MLWQGESSRENVMALLLPGKVYPVKVLTALLGYSSAPKVSWQQGTKECHKVTSHNKPHTRDWTGRKTIQEGEKEQGTEQKAGLYRISWGRRRREHGERRLGGVRGTNHDFHCPNLSELSVYGTASLTPCSSLRYILQMLWLFISQMIFNRFS